MSTFNLHYETLVECFSSSEDHPVLMPPRKVKAGGIPRCLSGSRG